MASRPPTRGRKDERHLSIRTLAIASLASLFAALVTSQLWRAGTPITAAITPVLVALISEIINRPTEKIAQRLTTEGTAVLPEAGGAGAPPRSPGRVPTRAPGEPGSGREPGVADRRPKEPEDALATGPVRVYGRPRSSRRKIALGLVLVTGLLGFAVAAAALTVPELITGHSIVKKNNRSTLFGGHHRKSKKSQQETTPTTTPTQTEQKTTTQETTTQKTTTQKQQTAPQQTAPSTTPSGEP
jgi:hypothetical protein